MAQLSESHVHSSSREFDLIIFGATGFTGRYVALRLAELEGAQRADGFSWAVAGRSRSRTQAVADECAAAHGCPAPAVIEADVSDATSLAAMAARGRALINCVGPYRFYGEQCVRACVEAATDYFDITGEPEFMERMELSYHAQAEANGCCIVSACGFDSIPADLGSAFASQHFGDGRCANIESFFTFNPDPSLGGKAHYATWQSAVEGFGSVSALRNVRRQLARPRVRTVGPRIPRCGLYKYDEGSAPCAGRFLKRFPAVDPKVNRSAGTTRACAAGRCPSRAQTLRYIRIPAARSLSNPYSVVDPER